MALNKNDLVAIKRIVDAKKFSLSEKDFNNIKELMNITIEERAQDLLVTKDEVKHLPTKEEFYNESDKMMKRLSNIEENMEVLNGLHEKVNDHDTRIEKVEKKLGLQA